MNSLKTKNGYVVDTFSGKFFHRVIYKNKVGPIPLGWVVHHIDYNKRNNKIENLIALPEKCHNILHKQMKYRPPTREWTEKFLIQFLETKKHIDKQRRHKRKRKSKRGIHEKTISITFIVSDGFGKPT